MTRRFSAAPALVLASLVPVLSGCGPSLISRVRSPFGGVCSLLWIVLAVMALLDVWKGPKSDSDKVIWTVFIVLVPVAGSVAYYLFGRK